MPVLCRVVLAVAGLLPLFSVSDSGASPSTDQYLSSKQADRLRGSQRSAVCCTKEEEKVPS